MFRLTTAEVLFFCLLFENRSDIHIPELNMDIKPIMLLVHWWDEITLATWSTEEEILAELSELAQVVKEGSDPVTREFMERFFHGRGTLALALNEERTIVAMASLVPIMKINSFSTSVEHVAVLPAYRGNGISERLVQSLVDYTARIAAKCVVLTCSPSREAANHVYEKLGFKLRSTNVRRLVLGD